MMSKARTPEEYVDEVAEERKEAVQRLGQTLRDNLPAGFSQTMS